MAYKIHTLNEQGFTLVEVMSSVLVFMVGVMAMMGVFMASLHMSKESTYAYKAHNLAKERIEALKEFDFDALKPVAPATVSPADETDTVIDEDGNSDLSGEYRRSTVVTTPYNGHDDLAEVTVSVTYTSRGTVNPTPMEITTLIMDT